MSAQGFTHSTIMVLTDGLIGGGEELVKLVYDKAWVSQVVGGAAGDDGKFRRTSVFGAGEVLSDAAVLVRIFSTSKLGIGVQHGMRSCSEPTRVTDATGGVLQRIGGRPAFAYYQEFARGRGVTLTPETAGPFMMNHELAIHSGTITKIRAPLSVNPDGSLNMAAEVPQGSLVSVVSSDEESLTRAAREAADEASRNLGAEAAAGVVVFDCICRRTILGDHFSREVDAIVGAFERGLPLIGCATYGEIARFGGKLNGFHNATAVVLALPR